MENGREFAFVRVQRHAGPAAERLDFENLLHQLFMTAGVEDEVVSKGSGAVAFLFALAACRSDAAKSVAPASRLQPAKEGFDEEEEEESGETVSLNGASGDGDVPRLSKGYSDPSGSAAIETLHYFDGIRRDA